MKNYVTEKMFYMNTIDPILFIIKNRWHSLNPYLYFPFYRSDQNMNYELKIHSSTLTLINTMLHNVLIFYFNVKFSKNLLFQGEHKIQYINFQFFLDHSSLTLLWKKKKYEFVVTYFKKMIKYWTQIYISSLLYFIPNSYFISLSLKYSITFTFTSH